MKMRIIAIACISAGFIALIGCSPVKTLASKEYQLSTFSAKTFVSKPRSTTIMVTAPEAIAEHQTAQMLYVTKPFQIEPFAKNEWVSPPADMLYPLIVQSLQHSGYFYAVASSLYNIEADYRVDTQLINLEQNFLKKPSVMDVTVKIVLTRTADNKIIASRIINQHIPCPMDTPYGGVIAANKATFQLTAMITRFVISHIDA